MNFRLLSYTITKSGDTNLHRPCVESKDPVEGVIGSRDVSTPSKTEMGGSRGSQILVGNLHATDGVGSETNSDGVGVRGD